MRYVIVGNSIAGMEAAIVLRKGAPDAHITLISEEHDHLFSRTALMYVFSGQLSLRDTEPYDHGLYDRLRFERVRDRVVAVDAAAHTLALRSGKTVPYDRLLLAVGSRARTLPGIDDPAVHAFVTLPDLQRLRTAARPGQHVAVIGGGLIGVEAAEMLHLGGLHVHFFVREPWYFPVALDEAEATIVAAHVRQHGVDVQLGTAVQDISRKGERLVLALPKKQLPVDLVVAAIGVVPNTTFLADGPITLSGNGAIETADDLSTRAPDIWAAGDCANVTWFDGARRPEQLWYTARDQGRIAARAMLGEKVVYRRGTWYNSAKFFDLEYTTAGYIPFPEKGAAGVSFSPPGYRTWFQAGQVDGRPVTQRIVLKGERVVGFNCLGSRWNHELFLRWIEEKRDLPWVLSHMEAARFDEEFVPPFRILPNATLTGS